MISTHTKGFQNAQELLLKYCFGVHIHRIRIFELMCDISRDTSLLTIYRDIETTTFMTRLQLILSSKISCQKYVSS
jgi:hypothetical protein